MVLMAACGVLLLAGVVLVVRWGGRTVASPPEPVESGEGGSFSLAARRYAWRLTVAVVAGVGAGLLVAGAGGRLIMRLLAVTADDSAVGRRTEAEEIVGQITTGGTLSFVLFTALFFGLASGLAYMVVQRWLPPGRLGGLAFGALLLVIAATTIEPLRADNADFDLVGPGWLAAAAFGALVVLHGMLVATLAARYGDGLPLLSTKRRSLLAHGPLLVFLPVFPAAIALIVLGAVGYGLSRVRGVAAAVASQRSFVAGRLALVVVAVVALPFAAIDIADIAGRHP
ncbi:MAG TPA: hypothetical protein VMY78_15730 [Solirubrobacteraceae bacterium]|nr:hypothetical protein [Solirubrobacteraceae bacterium]